jgi:group I intron endonuclease
MGIIYCAENLQNGKKYIGQTVVSLKLRKQKHLDNAFKYNLPNRFYEALRKYGESNFKWKILESEIPAKELDDKEIFYVNQFGSFGFGYNMTEGGSTLQGYSHSRKTKDKIGNSLKGRSNRDHYIKRYGEEIGMKKYEKYLGDMKEKRTGRTRLSTYIEKWGEEEGNRRYNIFIESIKEARKRKGPTNTIECFIEQYGIDEGQIKYAEFCHKMQNVWNNKKGEN